MKGFTEEPLLRVVGPCCTVPGPDHKPRKCSKVSLVTDGGTMRILGEEPFTMSR